MTLDDDQRDWLRGALKQTEIAAAPETVDRLGHLVEGSMDAYRAQQADETMRRGRHDALRDVWLLADRPDPPIGQIKAQIAALPSSAFADITARAAHLWPRVFRGDTYPDEGFQSSYAADELVRFLAADWADATGQAPQSGRSDTTGFGAMVHHVFAWLGLTTPDQSLRRYWEYTVTLAPTAIDGGLEYR